MHEVTVSTRHCTTRSIRTTVDELTAHCNLPGVQFAEKDRCSFRFLVTLNMIDFSSFRSLQAREDTHTNCINLVVTAAVRMNFFVNRVINAWNNYTHFCQFY